MDSNNIVYIDDYPLLFEVLQAEDRGDGTFAMPDFHDGTLRHIRVGDLRELGSFEMDEIKSHLHSQVEHTHSVPAHMHGLPNIVASFVGFFQRKGDYFSSFLKFVATLLGSAWTEGRDASQSGGYYKINMNTHNFGLKTTNNNGATTTGSAGGENTGNTGGSETRMKNTAGQWYILAKVTYIN